LKRQLGAVISPPAPYIKGKVIGVEKPSYQLSENKVKWRFETNLNCLHLFVKEKKGWWINTNTSIRAVVKVLPRMNLDNIKMFQG
jgi:hypothetical protein